MINESGYMEWERARKGKERHRKGRERNKGFCDNTGARRHAKGSFPLPLCFPQIFPFLTTDHDIQDDDFA